MTYMGEVAQVSAASLEDESEAINQQGKQFNIILYVTALEKLRETQCAKHFEK